MTDTPTPWFVEGQISLYHGDCGEILPALAAADLVLTDPPYGIDTAARGTVGVAVKAELRDYGRRDWDRARPAPALMEAVVRAGRRSVIFGGNYFADMLPASKCWLVWDKGVPPGFTKAQVELAWTNCTTYSRIYRVLWHGMIRDHQEERFHPTQKPLALMRAILCDLLPHGGAVLDPFAGSGSTLVAAREVGLTAIGIERELEYCQVAARRVSECRQLPLLPMVAPPTPASQGWLF